MIPLLVSGGRLPREAVAVAVVCPTCCSGRRAAPTLKRIKGNGSAFLQGVALAALEAVEKVVGRLGERIPSILAAAKRLLANHRLAVQRPRPLRRSSQNKIDAIVAVEQIGRRLNVVVDPRRRRKVEVARLGRPVVRIRRAGHLVRGDAMKREDETVERRRNRLRRERHLATIGVAAVAADPARINGWAARGVGRDDAGVVQAGDVRRSLAGHDIIGLVRRRTVPRAGPVQTAAIAASAAAIRSLRGQQVPTTGRRRLIGVRGDGHVRGAVMLDDIVGMVGRCAVPLAFPRQAGVALRAATARLRRMIEVAHGPTP